MRAAFDGEARAIVFGDLGISPVYVVDLAHGIMAALDRGRLGQAYVLGGENLRTRDAMTISALAGGRRPPRISIPNAVIRFMVPMGRLAVRVGTVAIDIDEVVRSADGVTFWASHAKATAELGYAPRPLRQGAVDAFGRS